MKERPIIFNEAMVKALLRGDKLRTRRVMNPQPEPKPDFPGEHWWPCKAVQSMVDAERGLRADDKHWKGLAATCCPLAEIGDHLYVRETVEEDNRGSVSYLRYRADGTTSEHHWDYNKGYAPSIHMRKQHARIWLEVTGIRAECLHQITEEDAELEGVKPAFTYPDWELGRVMSQPEYVAGFAKIWESTGEQWATNPWVWVLEFKILEHKAT